MKSFRPSGEPPLDHALLIAGVAIGQAATPTAQLAERIAQQTPSDEGDPVNSLVDVLIGSVPVVPDDAQGSFHPRLARVSGGKAAAELMKPAFTLAF